MHLNRKRCTRRAVERRMSQQQRGVDGGDCAIAITCLVPTSPTQHHRLEPPANIRWLALLVPSTCCAQYAPLTDAPMGPMLCSILRSILCLILCPILCPYYAHVMPILCPTDGCPILTCSLPGQMELVSVSLRHFSETFLRITYR